jgi:hypothetical protein
MRIIESHLGEWAKQQAAVVGADPQAAERCLHSFLDGRVAYTVPKQFQEVEDIESARIDVLIEFVDLFLSGDVALSLKIRSLENVMASRAKGYERVTLSFRVCSR